MPLPLLQASSASWAQAKRSGVPPGFMVMKEVAGGARGTHTPTLMSSMDALRYGPDHERAVDTVPMACWPVLAQLVVAGNADVATKTETRVASVWAELTVNWGQEFPGCQESRHRCIEGIHNGLALNKSYIDAGIASFTRWMSGRSNHENGVFEARQTLIAEAQRLGMEDWDMDMFENGDEIKNYCCKGGRLNDLTLKIKSEDDLRGLGTIRPWVTFALMRHVGKPQETMNVWMAAFFASVTCLTKGSSFTEEWLASRVESFKEEHPAFKQMQVSHAAVKCFCQTFPPSDMSNLALIGVLHSIHRIARDAGLPVFAWIIEQARLQKMTGLVLVARVVSRLDYCPLEQLIDYMPASQTQALIGGLVDCLTNPWGALSRPATPVSSMQDWVYFSREVSIKVFKESNLKNWQTNLTTARPTNALDNMIDGVASFQEQLSSELEGPLATICRKFRVKVVRASNANVVFAANVMEEGDLGETVGQAEEIYREMDLSFREFGGSTRDGENIKVTMATLSEFLRRSESALARALRALCEQVNGLTIQEELTEMTGVVDARNLIRPIPENVLSILSAEQTGIARKIDLHRAIARNQNHEDVPAPMVYLPHVSEDEPHDGCGADWFPERRERTDAATGSNRERMEQENAVHTMMRIAKSQASDPWDRMRPLMEKASRLMDDPFFTLEEEAIMKALKEMPEDTHYGYAELRALAKGEFEDQPGPSTRGTPPQPQPPKSDKEQKKEEKFVYVPGKYRTVQEALEAAGKHFGKSTDFMREVTWDIRSDREMINSYGYHPKHNVDYTSLGETLRECTKDSEQFIALVQEKVTVQEWNTKMPTLMQERARIQENKKVTDFEKFANVGLNYLPVRKNNAEDGYIPTLESVDLAVEWYTENRSFEPLRM